MRDRLQPEYEEYLYPAKSMCKSEFFRNINKFPIPPFLFK